MTARRSSVSETAEWAVVNPRAAALVSQRVVARAVRCLEDVLGVLDLTGHVGARARGVVGPVERAD